MIILQCKKFSTKVTHLPIKKRTKKYKLSDNYMHVLVLKKRHNNSLSMR